MKYNFDKAITNIDGNAVIEDGIAFTFKRALMSALIIDPPDMKPAEKLQRFELFLKIQRGESELSAEEVATAKKAAEVFPTLSYGQIVALLDQKGEA